MARERRTIGTLISESLRPTENTMSTGHHASNRCLNPMLSAASAVIAVLSITPCAAAPPAFNPYHLRNTQLSRIEAVCQNVMGLSPSERLIGGEWEGDSHLDYWTSRYRGCLTSLSGSVTKVSDNSGKYKTRPAPHLPAASGSLFYASPQETQRREEEACEAVGIAPPGDDFQACVSDLEETFHAIDTPIT
jgi:hypothetical protein